MSINELSSLASFSARKRFCEDHFSFLISGSCRRVYDIGNNQVLKLASNAKGIAQNEVESDYGLHRAYGSVLTEVYDSCPENYWLVCQKAVPAFGKDFKRIFDVSMKTLFSYLECNDSMLYAYYVPHFLGTEQEKKHLDNLDEIQDIVMLSVNFQILMGDIRRKNSWGLVDGRLVLTDYGCTKRVYEEFYSPKRRKQSWL